MDYSHSPFATSSSTLSDSTASSTHSLEFSMNRIYSLRTGSSSSVSTRSSLSTKIIKHSFSPFSSRLFRSSRATVDVDLESEITYPFPLLSALIPSRLPSNTLVASSQAIFSEGPVSLDFPLGWAKGPVMEWYKKRGGGDATIIDKIQLRKELYSPYHEYVVVYTRSGHTYRIDRRPDRDTPLDMIIGQGSTAYDTVEAIDSRAMRKSETPSDCVVELRWQGEHSIDLLLILSICFGIRQDEHAKRYTLQRYNCYFFAWTIIMIVVRNSIAKEPHAALSWALNWALRLSQPLCLLRKGECKLGEGASRGVNRNLGWELRWVLKLNSKLRAPNWAMGVEMGLELGVELGRKEGQDKGSRPNANDHPLARRRATARELMKAHGRQRELEEERWTTNTRTRSVVPVALELARERWRVRKLELKLELQQELQWREWRGWRQREWQERESERERQEMEQQLERELVLVLQGQKESRATLAGELRQNLQVQLEEEGRLEEMLARSGGPGEQAGEKGHEEPLFSILRDVLHLSMQIQASSHRPSCERYHQEN